MVVLIAQSFPASSINPMLSYAITFFVASVVTAIFGFGVLTSTAAIVVRVLCGCFAILLVVVVIRGTEPIVRR